MFPALYQKEGGVFALLLSNLILTPIKGIGVLTELVFQTRRQAKTLIVFPRY